MDQMVVSNSGIMTGLGDVHHVTTVDENQQLHQQQQADINDLLSQIISISDQTLDEAQQRSV